MGIVIKIGGSLADTAGTVLAAIEESGVNALIVPGGGAFADAVREKNLDDDDAAHWQAIAAMNRYGVFLSTFGYPLTETTKLPEKGAAILLPEKILKETDELPHSWEVTSDSIALWTAQRMNLPVVLVKSREGDAADPDYIDPFFSVLDKTGTTAYSAINGRDFTALHAFFRNISPENRR